MIRQDANRPHGHARGFTLIELLVSMTVLTVIVLLISQLFSSATNVTVSNRKRLDADSQARAVFDHLAFDLGKMLKRSDIDYLFAKVTDPSSSLKNDAMFFYSEAPAYFDLTDVNQLNTRSSVALVGYRINAAYQLERLGKQLTWDGVPSSPNPGGIMFLAPGTTTNSIDANSTLAKNWEDTIGKATGSPETPPYTGGSDAADYQVLADQVCRFEFCFQLKNGNLSPIPVGPLFNATTPIQNKLNASSAPTVSADSVAGFVVGSRWYDTTDQRGYVCVDSSKNAAVWNYLGMQDVRAIVVALAILDGSSAQIVPTTPRTVSGRQVTVPNLDSLIGLLSDADPSDATNPSSASQEVTVPSFPTAATTPAPVGSVQVRAMAEAWNNAFKKSGFAQRSGLPARAASQLRFYQRSFVLNNQ